MISEGGIWRITKKDAEETKLKYLLENYLELIKQDLINGAEVDYAEIVNNWRKWYSQNVNILKKALNESPYFKIIDGKIKIKIKQTILMI